jgi:hypothetical protein
LLAGRDREEALARVREVASDLVPLIETTAFASVTAGLGSFPVFYAYLDEVFPDEGHGDRAAELLARTVAQASAVPLLGLYGGCTGVAWLCDHLGASDDGDDPNAQIDALLLDSLAGPWTREYDLIGGIVGVGVYALERGERGAGRAILARVVEQLAAIATPQGDGLTWYTPAHFLPEWQRHTYPEGYYNLGMAHGVPGVIALLARSLSVGGRTQEMLAGAVRWVLAQAHDGGDARFGACITTARERPTRSAWCYGDPGVAMALVAAGRAAGEPRWTEYGLELARGVARRIHEAAGCVDAGLCHGTAGIAHLLNRLYQLTGDETLADGARAWFRETLTIRMGGPGGFREAAPARAELTLYESVGLLGGAIGVGLALMSAATDARPEWDRILLVDLDRP